MFPFLRQRLFGGREIFQVPDTLKPPKSIDVSKVIQTPDGPRYADQLVQETLDELRALNEEIQLAQSNNSDEKKQ